MYGEKNRCALLSYFQFDWYKAKHATTKKKTEQNRKFNRIHSFIRSVGRSVSQYLMYITYGYLAVINPIIHPFIHPSFFSFLSFTDLIWSKPDMNYWKTVTRQYHTPNTINITDPYWLLLLLFANMSFSSI